jgi:hypothetical protein
LARRPGTHVSIEWNPGGEAPPSAVGLLFMLERLIYGLPADDTWTAAPAELARFSAASGSADLVLDFTESVTNADTRDAARTWRITFDGVAGESRRTRRVNALTYPCRGDQRRGDGRRYRQRSPRNRNRGYLDPRVPRCAGTDDDADHGGARSRRVARSMRPRRQIHSNTITVARFAAKSLARAAARRLYRFATMRRIGVLAGASSKVRM